MTPCVYCGADTSGYKGWITPRARDLNLTWSSGAPLSAKPEDIRTCHAIECRRRAKRDTGR